MPSWVIACLQLGRWLGLDHPGGADPLSNQIGYRIPKAADVKDGFRDVTVADFAPCASFIGK